MTFLVDSNCMVALVSSWHEHHERAIAEIGRRLDRGERMLLAAPALMEAYSVLTRLPPPYRISPAESLRLLEANFVAAGEILAPDADDYLALMRRCAAEGIQGGQVYDAVIAACARRAQPITLLTFNERHFQPFSAWGLAVAAPGGEP